jgi:hypothetical protein
LSPAACTRVVVSVYLMASDDWSKENLFVQLVSRRLQLMQHHNIEPWDSPSRGMVFNPMDASYDSESSAMDLPGSGGSCLCGPRLDKLEKDVSRLQRGIDVIISRLPNSSAEGAGFVAAPMTTTVFSPSSLFRTASTSSLTSSDCSLSSSPRFEFTCPLCFKPQFTPKSHCEHMRNTRADGVHICRFNYDHNRHARILQVWGSADCFVRWYCSFLRSGVGSKFTEADMLQFQDLQQRLDNALRTGSYTQ